MGVPTTLVAVADGLTVGVDTGTWDGVVVGTESDGFQVWIGMALGLSDGTCDGDEDGEFELVELGAVVERLTGDADVGVIVDGSAVGAVDAVGRTTSGASDGASIAEALGADDEASIIEAVGANVCTSDGEAVGVNDELLGVEAVGMSDGISDEDADGVSSDTKEEGVSVGVSNEVAVGVVNGASDGDVVGETNGAVGDNTEGVGAIVTGGAIVGLRNWEGDSVGVVKLTF